MTSVEFQSEYASDLAAQPPIPANTKVYEVLSPEVRAALYIDDIDKIPKKVAFQKELPPEVNQACSISGMRSKLQIKIYHGQRTGIT